jgi:predicted Fe-Mo cluster-binding NifX family protein
MKICMPVSRLNGLASELAPDFRSAPALMLIDSETLDCRGIDAGSGACGVMPSEIDAVVFVDGMGRGMFNGLRQHGIRVFSAPATSVADALSRLTSGSLDEVDAVACCGGGHAHQHEEGAAGTGCGCGSHATEAEHSHGTHGACCGRH